MEIQKFWQTWKKKIQEYRNTRKTRAVQSGETSLLPNDDGHSGKLVRQSDEFLVLNCHTGKLVKWSGEDIFPSNDVEQEEKPVEENSLHDRKILQLKTKIDENSRKIQKLEEENIQLKKKFVFLLNQLFK